VEAEGFLRSHPTIALKRRDQPTEASRTVGDPVQTEEDKCRMHQHRVQHSDCPEHRGLCQVQQAHGG
jgi:hypothetical protein